MSIDRLHTREIGLGIVLLLGILMFATTGSTGTNGTHEMIEWFGIFAILLCIFGRTWTSLYIGGRKNRALLTKGPYSVVRNPLYVFSILGAAGAGAQLGSVISSVIIGLLVWMVFYIEVLREERNMAARHGANYAAYKTSVPRFLPNPFTAHVRFRGQSGHYYLPARYPLRSAQTYQYFCTINFNSIFCINRPCHQPMYPI